jgi:hypothetical protein
LDRSDSTCGASSATATLALVSAPVITPKVVVSQFDLAINYFAAPDDTTGFVQPSA